jgi:hypothetical protein
MNIELTIIFMRPLPYFGVAFLTAPCAVAMFGFN